MCRQFGENWDHRRSRGRGREVAMRIENWPWRQVLVGALDHDIVDDGVVMHQIALVLIKEHVELCQKDVIGVSDLHDQLPAK
jgi:hypothetical protein